MEQRALSPARICFPFVGNLVGGSHVSTAGLIAKLDRNRFEPLVLLQHDKGLIASLLREQGINFEKAPDTAELTHGRPVSARGALKLLAAAPRLAGVLRRRAIDIVHCNDGRTLATWALAARLSGARLLWHHRGAPDAAGLRLVAPAIANRVVAVSQFAAPKPGWYSAAGRVSVIHSPFDTDLAFDRGEARRVLLEALPNSGGATRIIAFSGALIDRKRPLLFVKAIAALRRAAPDRDVRGVLFGVSFDNMADCIRALAVELGVADVIHLLGHRTPGPFWLAGSDMLMVSAINEPFGRTLIEAMLVGTPVVATASGGNVEAIQNERTGLLVPPEDPDALASACQFLLDDGSRATAIAAMARFDARQRFGEDRHANAIMALYADMLGPERRHARRAGNHQPTATAAAYEQHP